MRASTTACVLVGSALLPCAASAAPADGAAARASAAALATLRASVRADDALHADAIRALTTGLRSGAVTPAAAFASHAAALSFLVEKADRAADRAADAFLGDVSAAMLAEGDAELAGAVPGAGGAIDAFAPAVEREFARLRLRVAARLAKFAKSYARDAGGLAALRTDLAPWTFRLPSAPTAAGPIPGGDEPPRLWCLTAARLPDASLAVAAAGTASVSFDGEFDLRMRGAVVEPLVLLADGGISVGEDGAWTTGVVTFTGDTPQPGARTLQFGAEPFDGGLAGRQPGRLLLAGVTSIP